MSQSSIEIDNSMRVVVTWVLWVLLDTLTFMARLWIVEWLNDPIASKTASSNRFHDTSIFIFLSYQTAENALFIIINIISAVWCLLLLPHQWKIDWHFEVMSRVANTRHARQGGWREQYRTWMCPRKRCGLSSGIVTQRRVLLIFR